jgi:hypothetical protein
LPVRRTLLALLTVVALTAGRAEAVTIRDIIELSKAGLSDSVLIALIETDRRVFTIDNEILKQLKDGGVSDTVIVALIRTGRSTPLQPAAPPLPVPDPQTPLQTPDPEPGTTRDPRVIVIDHRDPQPAPQQQPPVLYPVGISVPGLYPGYASSSFLTTGSFITTGHRGRFNQTVRTVIPTDQGLVKARVPVPANCVKAQPVYWGFGGKLRPGSWEPPPTVVCR